MHFALKVKILIKFYALKNFKNFKKFKCIKKNELRLKIKFRKEKDFLDDTCSKLGIFREFLFQIFFT